MAPKCHKIQQLFNNFVVCKLWPKLFHKIDPRSLHKLLAGYKEEKRGPTAVAVQVSI
jgi:hypothetical protein